MRCGAGSLLRKGTASDGLLSIIAATVVHNKSINVQDISIQRSFSTATSNLVRLAIAVKKDLAVYVRYYTVYGTVPYKVECYF